jgi:CRISPR-associated RAMP protein (TIGR02581 family)
MHKRLVNELRLDLLIAPQSPLLIKSGKEAGADPTLLDMNFVRTNHASLGRTVYLPGSSLKGVVRSYCEKIGRTVGLDVCDPLTDESCGRRLGTDSRLRKASGAEIYQELCPICRLFGHTVMASHVWFADAYPTPGTIEAVNDTEERDGVAIDRISGAVAVGPFQLEVVTRGVFQAQLTVRNFQLWQVGLLAVALRDMADGRVPIGFAKSRGLGQVALTYRTLQISYPGQFGETIELDFGTYLYGVTAFGIEEDYGFFPEAPLPLPAPRHAEPEWGRVTLTFEDAGEIEALLKAAVGPWADYVSRSARG